MIHSSQKKLGNCYTEYEELAGEQSKAIIYYTSNIWQDPALEWRRPRPEVFHASAKQLIKAAKDIPIIWVSQRELDFEAPGTKLVIGTEHGHSRVSLCVQLMLGIMETEADVVFCVEHDVLYHESHFEAISYYEEETYYYNQNAWFGRPWGNNYSKPNRTRRRALSHLSARRQLVLDSTIGRLRDMHSRQAWYPGRDLKTGEELHIVNYHSVVPNIDIRHGKNLTGARKTKARSMMATLPYWGTYNEAIARGLNGE